MGETTEGSDGLIGKISSGGSRFGVITFGDSVNLLINFSSVMVTELTGSWDSPSNSGWMPGSDATDLSKTSMGFLLKMFDAESLHDACDSLTLGDTQDVDHFIVFENIADIDFFFEETISVVNLLCDGSSVNLDFENVILLLSEG
jgi:hypothetical protein